MNQTDKIIVSELRDFVFDRWLEDVRIELRRPDNFRELLIGLESLGFTGSMTGLEKHFDGLQDAARTLAIALSKVK